MSIVLGILADFFVLAATGIWIESNCCTRTFFGFAILSLGVSVVLAPGLWMATALLLDLTAVATQITAPALI